VLKTRIITELFKQARYPVALLRNNVPEWHNPPFDDLSEDIRTRLIDRAASGADDPLLLDGYLFESLTAGPHRLLIGTPAATADPTLSASLPAPPEHPLDELTGLPGRAAFDATLETFEQHYRHDRQNCEMAMLDINGLSSINQRNGMEFGDEVLRRFARKLRHICRPDDRLFRFGGDEFVVLMPYRQKPPPLQKRLSEIEREMRALQGLERFSASAGIANLSETNGSSDDLMLLSDRRLHQAKAVRNETQGHEHAQ